MYSLLGSLVELVVEINIGNKDIIWDDGDGITVFRGVHAWDVALDVKIVFRGLSNIPAI